MRIRGRRRCRECGEEWSYYETAEVTCPTCGSIRSVGVEDEGELHTDAPATLELTESRANLAKQPLREVAAAVEETARNYVTARGFINAGDLQALDDEVLAAAELRHVSGRLRRGLDTPTDREEAHFLALLEGAPDGDRPEEIPDSLHGARGLATADVIDGYRRDVSRWLDEHPDDAAAEFLGMLREHVKRLEALDGVVPPADADRLVAATRDLGRYLREDDETALARAHERLT